MRVPKSNPGRENTYAVALATLPEAVHVHLPAYAAEFRRRLKTCREFYKKRSGPSLKDALTTFATRGTKTLRRAPIFKIRTESSVYRSQKEVRSSRAGGSCLTRVTASQEKVKPFLTSPV